MFRKTLCALCLLTLGSTITCADEGMWLFNDLPTKHLKERYGFKPTEEWAKHVRLSSVRFNVGGSGSFVSSTGLVLTNHHVASDTLFKLSNSERDVAKDGYLAKDHATELKAPDLELNVLAAIEDVTDRVMAAVQSLSADKAAEARRAVMAEIEKESLDATGLRSDVVTLFGGSKFHLYRYRKYTDVRLVWAPEADIAFFGGDADNFEYPRYCLDVTLFRVYENGKPAKIEHHLKWADKVLEEEELVFVSGNPGRTQRLYTVDAFKYMRDVRNPYVLNFIRRKEVLMQQFGLGGIEQKRRAQDDLFGLQNSRKAYMGMLGGLQNPAIMERKQRAETQLVAAVRQNQQTRELATAWADISRLQKEKASTQGTVSSFRSRLYDIAETLVLMAAEDQKPGTERLREFRDSARESLEQDLFSTAPIYPDLERVKLADEIARLVEKRGGDDELVAKVLAGRSPGDRAAQLVSDTKLFEPATREAIAKGGSAAIASSVDPLIQLAKIMEPELRAYRKHSEELAEQERQAYAKISQATVAIQGTGTYPDATFTLRLAFGPVRSYQENGATVPAWTTMGGAFQHETNHGAKDDWKLPKSWHDARAKITDSTPFNFVCTADIIGGNSGSPVINRQAEFVGIIFDGNIQSLTSNYLYTDEVSRAVSVSASAIREAMRVVYGADKYADELGK
ncbi:MAG: S46 family peptidase [Fuerstiella sp.]|nr:S46 family peptidase [Fuerstiella sp.]MCP4859063.1 S46 family peptidase [Fuerstiella sp.]